MNNALVCSGEARPTGDNLVHVKSITEDAICRLENILDDLERLLDGLMGIGCPTTQLKSMSEPRRLGECLVGDLVAVAMETHVKADRLAAYVARLREVIG